MKIYRPVILAVLCFAASIQNVWCAPLQWRQILVSPPEPLLLTGIAQMEFTRDGRFLVVGWAGSAHPTSPYGYRAPGVVDVWDIKKRSRIHRLRASDGELMGLSISPDGRRVAGVFAGGGWRMRSEADAKQPAIRGRVVVWELASGKQIAVWTSGQARLYSVAFATDNQRVAAGGGDGQVRLWRIGKRSADWQSRLGGSRGYVSGLALAPQGGLYATKGDGLFILNLGNGAARRILQNSDISSASTLAIAPDGGSLVLLGSNTISKVSLPSAEIGATWRHQAIRQISISHDGRFVGGFSQYGSGFLWDDSGREIAQFRSILNANSNWHPVGLTFSEYADTLAVAGVFRVNEPFSVRLYTLPPPQRNVVVPAR